MNQTESKHALFVSLVCGLFIAVLILVSVYSSTKTDVTSATLSATAAVSLVEPDISAEAYVVRLVGSDTPLIGRRVDKPTAPASLTKVMTAVVASEKLSATDTGVMSLFAKNVEERKSSAKEGDEFLRDELIRMALVMSANDAVLALAERVAAEVAVPMPTLPVLRHQSPGRDMNRAAEPQTISAAGHGSGTALFVRMMNAKARILGMDHTHFENPTGLDMPRHFTTANDLARLAEYVLVRHPSLWAMSRAWEAQAETVQGKTYPLTNSNDLLKEFPALIGGKTGMTDNAKEALMLLYPVEPDQTAIVVILRSDDRFGDGRKILNWLEENF
mgnify:CR=1 FL=1